MDWIKKVALAANKTLVSGTIGLLVTGKFFILRGNC